MSTPEEHQRAGRRIAQAGGSWESATEISEAAGRAHREYGEERKSELIRNWTVQSSPNQNSSSDGGVAFVGILVEAGYITYALSASRSSYGDLALQFAIIFIIYMAVNWLVPVVRWFCLTIFSAYFFLHFIYPPSYSWEGILIGSFLIMMMTFDRFVMEITSTKFDPKGFLVRAAGCLLVASVLASSFISPAVTFFDKSLGLTHSGRLMAAGYSEANSDLIVYRYDRFSDRYIAGYGAKFAQIKSGSVVKVGKIVEGRMFTCIGNEAAMFDSIDQFEPAQQTGYHGNGFHKGDYSKDTCNIQVPRVLRN